MLYKLLTNQQKSSVHNMFTWKMNSQMISGSLMVYKKLALIRSIIIQQKYWRFLKKIINYTKSLTSAKNNWPKRSKIVCQSQNCLRLRIGGTGTIMTKLYKYTDWNKMLSRLILTFKIYSKQWRKSKWKPVNVKFLTINRNFRLTQSILYLMKTVFT